MRHLWELQSEIEDARKRLNVAIEQRKNDEICYKLSVNLDKLIERYIDLQEQDSLAIS